MKREQKITLGKAGIAVVRKKIRRVRLCRLARRRAIIAAMAALVLLPIEVSDAGWLSDVFKSSSKHGKSPKHVARQSESALAKHAASPKPHTVKLAALGPAALSLPL